MQSHPFSRADIRPVDADGVRAKVRANFEARDPELLEVLADVCRKYNVDEEGGLMYIEAQLVERLQARQQTNSASIQPRSVGTGSGGGGGGGGSGGGGAAGGGGRGIGGIGKSKITGAVNHRSDGSSSSSSTVAETSAGENVLDAAAEESSPSSSSSASAVAPWNAAFEGTKEFEEMQAARAYVVHRKQIADVLHCVKAGDVRGVIAILEEIPSILEYRDQDGWNLLFHGIIAKNQLVVRWILTQDGIDPNHRDRNSLTALHWAAFTGNVKICKMLVDVKADVQGAADRAGCTPLHLAAHAGQEAVVRWYFSNYPFFITQQDRDGATPLHYAALQGQERLLFLMIDLIREEADDSFDLCRLVDHDDANILHYAGVGGHFKTAQALVRDTALLTLGRSKTMEDPAETARANGHSKIYNFLNKKAEALRRAQSLGEALERGEELSFSSMDEGVDSASDDDECGGSSQENVADCTSEVGGRVTTGGGGGSVARANGAAGKPWVDQESKPPPGGSGAVVANRSAVKTRQSEDSILAADEIALEIPQSILDAP